MGELRKDWADAKKRFDSLPLKDSKGTTIDAKKVFGKGDLGPALDAAEDAMAALMKKESVETVQTASDALNKAALIVNAYSRDFDKLKAKLTNNALIAVEKTNIGGQFVKLGIRITKDNADVDKAKKRVVADDPTIAVKAVDAALKKAVAGLSVVASKADGETWTAEVTPAMEGLCKAFKMSSRLQNQYLKTFEDLRRVNGDDRAAVLTQLKAAAAAVKTVQTGYKKVLGVA